jgi:catechol 2,3-dioxygenase-like lactoylglutathione lyase family enzyme
MIDHVTLNVGDLEAATGFYSQALAPLGYTLLMEFEGAAGFGARGQEGMPDFWLGSRPERGAAHVAFSTRDRATVDEFHAAALGAGATDNGAPGLRPAYGESYYAAFVHDADGNNLEAVCHGPE